jgi:hypothetical protein
MAMTKLTNIKRIVSAAIKDKPKIADKENVSNNIVTKDALMKQADKVFQNYVKQQF